MSKVLVEESNLQNIAKAIRNKNGESTTYKPSEMSTAIDNLSSSDLAPADCTAIEINDINSKETIINYIDNISIENLSNNYGFFINDNGYYESNNKGANSSYALCKLSFNANIDNATLVLNFINSGESSYDFGIISNIDTTLASSNSEDSSNVYHSFKGESSTNVVELTYTEISKGEHFITIKYKKDGSSHSGNDSLQFKVIASSTTVSNTNITLTWTDPDDAIADVGKVAEWAGTKVVYKTDDYPKNDTDGTVLIDSKIKNQYKYTPYKIDSSLNNESLYCQLFPYSKTGKVNNNVTNRIAIIKYALLFNVTPNTATIVLTDSNSNIITADSSGKFKVKAGTYNYEIIASGYKKIKGSVTLIDSDKTIDVVMEKSSNYGVRRQLSSSDTAWERIEDSVGLVANATHDGSAVQNDFDDIYPWSDIITVDVSADGTINSKYGDADFSFTNPVGYIMTYIPEFWYKRYQEDKYEYIYISSSELDGYTHSEASYWGRYTMGGSSSAVNTKSGVSNFVNITRANARAYAQKVGANWGITDILRWSLLQILYLVEYADYNSQNILGLGRSNSSNSSTINTGSCDSLGMKSGCLNNDGKNGVIYRGIENPFGNIFQWIDGVNIVSRKAYVSTNRNGYVDDTTSGDYSALSYTNAKTNGYPKQLGYDSSNSAIQFPTVIGESNSTYIPDYYYQDSGTRVVCVGGGWGNDTAAGLFCFGCYDGSSSSYTNIGARLLFIPE